MFQALKTKRIKTNEVICSKYEELKVESDVIVPDIKPDIKKILSVDGYVVIEKKAIQKNKLVIEGKVMITIIYIPEGDCMGNIKHITFEQPFVHTTEITETSGDVVIYAEAELESIDSKYLNSRKLKVFSSIYMNIKAFKTVELDIAVDIEEEGIEKKTSKICPCNLKEEIAKTIEMIEICEVPQGRGDIAELLQTTAKIYNRNVIIERGKVEITGEVIITFLYISQENGSLQSMQEIREFRERIDLGNTDERTEERFEGAVGCDLKEIKCEIKEDADGLNRILQVQVSIEILVKGLEVFAVEILRDAYGINNEVKLTRKKHEFEELMGKTRSQISQKDIIMLPEAIQIYDCKNRVRVDKVSIENNKVIIEGEVLARLMYITEDESNKVSTYNHSSKFSQRVDMETKKETSCDVSANIEHWSQNLGMDGEVELKYIVGININMIKKREWEIIQELKKEEDSKEEMTRASIVIYYVQEGDTLWSIAKNYRKSMEDVIKRNNLDSDTLTTGQQLII